MDDGIFQLVFLALVVVGWLIRAAAEQRKRHEERSAPRPPAPRPRPPSRPAPAEVPEPTPTGVDVARHAELVAETDLVSIPSGLAAPGIAPPTAALVTDAEIRRRAALRRLAGGLDVEPGLELVRAGVLWSEVLGPCRSLRGPHRPPIFQRRRG